MDNDRRLSYQQIIDRISSDKALDDLLHPLLEEVRQLRAELSELREVLGGGTAVKYLTIPEVAEMLGVCAETVRRRTRAGEWPASVIGRQTRFGPEEIAAIRESLVKRVPDPPLSTRERRRRNKRNRALLRGRE